MEWIVTFLREEQFRKASEPIWWTFSEILIDSSPDRRKAFFPIRSTEEGIRIFVNNLHLEKQLLGIDRHPVEAICIETGSNCHSGIRLFSHRKKYLLTTTIRIHRKRQSPVQESKCAPWLDSEERMWSNQWCIAHAPDLKYNLMPISKLQTLPKYTVCRIHQWKGGCSEYDKIGLFGSFRRLKIYLWNDSDPYTSVALSDGA